MKAWTTALRAMDSLIRGMPQQVQDGASLLGISSWHLYPDISVAGKTSVEVQQNDPVFGPISVLSLGLQVKDERSVSWSLQGELDASAQQLDVKLHGATREL